MITLILNTFNFYYDGMVDARSVDLKTIKKNLMSYDITSCLKSSFSFANLKHAKISDLRLSIKIVLDFYSNVFIHSALLFIVYY